jgi:hypothetical protein
MLKVGLVVVGLLVGGVTVYLIPTVIDQHSDARLIDDAKAAVRKKLNDPDSARFEELRIVKIGEIRIVCGTVNARNRLGGYAGRQPFFYNGIFVELYGDGGERIVTEDLRACRGV